MLRNMNTFQMITNSYTALPLNALKFTCFPKSTFNHYETKTLCSSLYIILFLITWISTLEELPMRDHARDIRHKVSYACDCTLVLVVPFIPEHSGAVLGSNKQRGRLQYILRWALHIQISYHQLRVISLRTASLPYVFCNIMFLLVFIYSQIFNYGPFPGSLETIYIFSKYMIVINILTFMIRISSTSGLIV